MTPDKAERRQRLAGFEKKATRIAIGLIIAAVPLGLIAAMLGAAEVYPSEYATPVGIAATLAPIGLALLIGAVGGLYIMGGWKVAPFGVVFVAGFAGLVYGIGVDAALWRLVGAGLLGISGAAFYAVGTLSARVPIAMLNLWGNTGALVAGTLVAVLGYVTDIWGLLLFGVMAVGCAVGGLLGRWQYGRRERADAQTES